jgi:hypothetical protein
MVPENDKRLRWKISAKASADYGEVGNALQQKSAHPLQQRQKNSSAQRRNERQTNSPIGD